MIKKEVPVLLLTGYLGSGKTTLAHILAKKIDRPFYNISAINAGVKDVRDVIAKATEGANLFQAAKPILFIDEIHRFSKSQQDSLLAAVEKGVVTLIGATTENPSFEVISPLLSRCRVYVLKPLDKEDLLELAETAVKQDYYLKQKEFDFKQTQAMLQYSGGDARKLLNLIELLYNTESSDKVEVTNDAVVSVVQENPAIYDKQGEMHYDIISAFIKSVRGSDPDAAVYWLARMIEGGEDPKFIARRLLILASEDIGLANPNALLMANACFDTVHKLGWPEARIALAEATVYLASSPKSNSAYMAVDGAIAYVKKTGNLPVPLHLRNAPTKLMKDMEYAKGYKYPHDFDGHFVRQQYMPDEAEGERFYHPAQNPSEDKLAAYLNGKWNAGK